MVGTAIAAESISVVAIAGVENLATKYFKQFMKWATMVLAFAVKVCLDHLHLEEEFTLWIASPRCGDCSPLACPLVLSKEGLSSLKHPDLACRKSQSSVVE